MTADEFEYRIVDWARQRPGVEALIQMGSRTQSAADYDKWSDWDFHLISKRPREFYSSEWITEIAPTWCAHSERSIRGRVKVSAVFEDGLEADFVPLSNWQMRTVYWAMKHPKLAWAMPRRLQTGILETREILLNSGYKVLVGGSSWHRRLAALGVTWNRLAMDQAEFARHAAAFWQKSVWVTKKIARPEARSAMHWLHKLILEHVYAMLEEEAWLDGRRARPEALKAEKWLDSRRLAQTEVSTDIRPRGLALALLTEINLFKEVSCIVAAKREFHLRDYTAVESWLRTELEKITALDAKR